MHNFILQVDAQPIDKEEYVDAMDLFEEQLQGIADYADDVSDTEAQEIAKSIIEHEFGFELTDGSFAITDLVKQARLTASFMAVQEFIDKLQAIGLEEFLARFDDWYWSDKFESATKGNTGTYIYFDGILYKPLQFIRIAEPDRRYYVGGVVDYHW